MLELEGKTAVVTGAGRGLGRHVAIGLARRGAKLALVGRNIDALRSAADEIRQAGGVAIALAADVAQIDDVERAKGQVGGELGAAQILINAAGVFGPIALVHDSDPKRWIETLATNTVGPYLTCRAFVPDMIARGWGRIINFSSAASLHPPAKLNSAYGTSKAALNQLTRHLAAELAGTGVTANVIHPGEVKTDMWAAIRQESQTTGPQGEDYRAWAEHVARTGGDDPERALDLVVKLIGNESADTSGQFLWITDGLQKPIPGW
jgi:NAD(P)-dependent dehydrogenase (short-subunit alcohol dehydrogenase family)